MFWENDLNSSKSLPTYYIEDKIAQGYDISDDSSSNS